MGYDPFSRSTAQARTAVIATSVSLMIVEIYDISIKDGLSFVNLSADHTEISTFLILILSYFIMRFIFTGLGDLLNSENPKFFENIECNMKEVLNNQRNRIKSQIQKENINFINQIFSDLISKLSVDRLYIYCKKKTIMSDDKIAEIKDYIMNYLNDQNNYEFLQQNLSYIKDGMDSEEFNDILKNSFTTMKVDYTLLFNKKKFKRMKYFYDSRIYIIDFLIPISIGLISIIYSFR